jgi:hypothetical protein
MGEPLSLLMTNDDPSRPDDPQQPWEQAPIDVDLSGLRSLRAATERADIPHKEMQAAWVAKAIVAIFGSSMVLSIILGFVLAFWLRWHPDKAHVIFTQAIIPFMEKIATFSATVFGPLLAFVLGYYFGEKQARQ